MTARTSTNGDGVANWILLRLTGVALSVLVLGHFALTHIINDVAETDSAFVADRFGNALFLTWDGAMLVAALVHGAAGLWIIAGEYAGTRRRSWRGSLVALTTAMAVVGIVTLVVAR